MYTKTTLQITEIVNIDFSCESEFMYYAAAGKVKKETKIKSKVKAVTLMYEKKAQILKPVIINYASFPKAF